MSGITGRKPSELNDPVVTVGLNDSWLVLETSDGAVVKIRPFTLATLFNEGFAFLSLAFSGTNVAVPVGENNGKFPDDDDKIKVYTNGVLDYPVQDYTIIRNAGATPDEVQFVAARAGDDILVTFTL
jgi:hypothetical protein